MPNNYVTLANAKTDLGITGATYDAALVRLIERVSRAIDDQVHRRFYSEIATRLYDGAGNRELWLPDDLLTVTTLKVDEDGDGTFELTLAVNTDYWLWPDNSSPKIRIDLNPDGTQLSAWTKARRSVQVAGMFGYSNDTELTTTTLNEDLDATETGIDVVSGAVISVGDTIIVDSEQMYVSAVATNTLTAIRGVNGTTAATHTNGTAVSRRRYPAAIEQAVTMQVARLWNEQKTGYSGGAGGPEMGGFSFSTLYPAIQDMLAPYSVPVVG